MESPISKLARWIETHDGCYVLDETERTMDVASWVSPGPGRRLELEIETIVKSRADAEAWLGY